MLSHTSRAATALKLSRAAIPAGAAVLAVAIACANQEPPAAPRGLSAAAAAAAEGTRYGPLVPMGPGTARTYVTLADGVPVELGVEMTEGAIRGRPAAAAHGSEHHADEDMFELPLPPEAAVTAYKSVNVGWMANGHEAPYNRPHFDFHFYTITAAERQAIDPADPAWAEKAASLPAGELVPARYFALSTLINKPAAAVTVPRMGLHWLDVASPELQPPDSPQHKPFTHTLFYGSWDGAMIFAEPMITKALLESRESVSVTLPAAARYAPAGLHARGYRVYWDGARQRHRVALVSLTASSQP